MKFPLVLRSSYMAATDALLKKDAHIGRLNLDLERMKESLGSARAECFAKADEIKGLHFEIDRLGGITAEQAEELSVATELNSAHRAEIENLTAAIEKLRGEYNELGKMVPAFRPKAVRWSGPDGVRAKIERAIIAQAQERTAVVATNSETRGQ